MGWRISQRVKVKSKVHGYGKVGTVVRVFEQTSSSSMVLVKLDTEDQQALYSTRDLRKVKKFT